MNSHAALVAGTGSCAPSSLCDANADCPHPEAGVICRPSTNAGCGGKNTCGTASADVSNPSGGIKNLFNAPAVKANLINSGGSGSTKANGSGTKAVSGAPSGG